MDVSTIALLWVVSVALGVAIGYSRGSTIEGGLWPLILGPLGLLGTIAFVKRPVRQ